MPINCKLWQAFSIVSFASSQSYVNSLCLLALDDDDAYVRMALNL